MEFIANRVNNAYLSDLLDRALSSGVCTRLDAAVAYVGGMTHLTDLCKKYGVPLNLWCLCNSEAHPNISTAKRFVNGPPDWNLYLTADYFHPKVLWFRETGAYIGSANLTDRAWWQNIEAGVFFSEDELVEAGLDIELTMLFDYLVDRSRAATREDLKAIHDLAEKQEKAEADRRRKLEADFRRSVVLPIPGQKPPAFRLRSQELRMNGFVQEWTGTLELLRKLGKTLEEHRQPRSWIPDGTPVSIELDQMLNWYYEEHIARQEADVRTRCDELHLLNQENAKKAFMDMVEEWNALEDAQEFIKRTFAEWAPYLRKELALERLSALTEVGLIEIFNRSHAIRDHARRVPNRVLGLPDNQHYTADEKAEYLAGWVWRQKTRSGKTVVDLLRYLLSGSVQEVPGRLWEATQQPGSPWALPRLKISGLGELIGWARPDEFPPRNNRVSRALYALGYDVKRYGD